MMNTGTFDDYDDGAYDEESYDDGAYDDGGYDDGGHDNGAYDDAYGDGGEQPPRRSRAPLIAVIIAAIAAAAILFLWFDPLDLNLFGRSGNSAATASDGSGKSDGGTGTSQSGGDDWAEPVPSPGAVHLDFVSADVSDYPTVRLYYSCADSSGQAVTLTDPIANVTERLSDGTQIERTVRSVMQLEGRRGLSIDLVVDKSASMSNSLPDVQRILSQFINTMDFAAGDSAEVIAFDTFTMYMCTYTQDPALLLNGIANMSTYGDTALYDALYTAVTNASGRAGARCVIGFTDGEDNRSTHTMQEVVNLAVEKEVPIFLIGTGSASYQTLTDLCMPTGGTYWDISQVADLSAIMAQIYQEQKQLYCIEYEADPGMDAYAERTVICMLSERPSGNGAAGGGAAGGSEAGGGAGGGAADGGAAGDNGSAGSYCEATFTPSQVQETEAHTSRYEVIRADVSWTEANDDCIARGGHLVTITSQDEQNQMIALAEQAGIRFVWIGGYTSVRENTAYGHWITGEPFDYTAWYPGEPSRNDLDGVPEFYLMLWNVNDSWSWNDERNDPIRETGLAYFPGNVGYICEYED